MKQGQSSTPADIPVDIFNPQPLAEIYRDCPLEYLQV